VARIGLFGGTFDPPHVGHLIVAQDVLERMSLDRLLLIPAREPPHKPAAPRASPEVRARMVEAAVLGHPRMDASRIELEREGPSYTVDTLRALKASAPADELVLVMGADQIRGFAGWRSPDEIIRLARVVVVGRAGEPVAHASVEHESVEVTRVDVSSTDIRRRVREGRSIRFLVPDAVLRIIEQEGLYQVEKFLGDDAKMRIDGRC
jgi:nicotinate-nucleotide adenylyltransferase